MARFPPGTSKWNGIEHRMFCHITQNRRGRSFVSRQMIVDPIAATTTRAGLRIRSELDDNAYTLGTRVTDGQMKEPDIRRDGFHGDWNYRESTIITTMFSWRLS